MGEEARERSPDGGSEWAVGCKVTIRTVFDEVRAAGAGEARARRRGVAAARAAARAAYCAPALQRPARRQHCPRLLCDAPRAASYGAVGRVEHGAAPPGVEGLPRRAHPRRRTERPPITFPTPSPKEVTGTVFAYDASTRSLVLKQPGTHGGVHNLRLYSAGAIRVGDCARVCAFGWVVVSLSVRAFVCVLRVYVCPSCV
jgi:hypothetical protein